MLEINGVKLLTDPGSFTAEAQEKVTGLHGILITHEHADHFHLDSLKALRITNPSAVVVCNSTVATLIAEQFPECPVTVVGDGQSADVGGVKVEGFGKDHALVYPPNMGLVENTGYFVADTFYFPGDAFHNPGKPVDVLALPVAGPWMKVAEAVDFAKAIKARTAFGVHDGMVQPFFRSYIGNILKNIVPETAYISLADGETREF